MDSITHEQGDVVGEAMSGHTALAMVVLPLPDKPVKNTQ
jgi:hypothetical protein